MDEFPKGLYRQPGADVQTDSGWCAYMVVNDAEQLAAALADGWHDNSPAAAEAAKAPVVADDNAPPTRAELEQKAAELGLKVDGRWSDKKLSDTIAAALEA